MVTSMKWFWRLFVLHSLSNKCKYELITCQNMSHQTWLNVTNNEKWMSQTSPKTLHCNSCPFSARHRSDRKLALVRLLLRADFVIGEEWSNTNSLPSSQATSSFKGYCGSSKQWIWLLIWGIVKLCNAFGNISMMRNTALRVSWSIVKNLSSHDQASVIF